MAPDASGHGDIVEFDPVTTGQASAPERRRPPFAMSSRFPLKVLLPLALGVAVSIAILIFAEIGYQRLELANRQSTGALEIEAKLNDLVGLTSDAETGQRGFLLTGDPSYLEPYKEAVRKLDATLADLRETVAQEGTPPQRDRMS